MPSNTEYNLSGKQKYYPPNSRWSSETPLTPVFKEEYTNSTSSDVHCTRKNREFEGFYLFGGLNYRGEALDDYFFDLQVGAYI